MIYLSPHSSQLLTLLLVDGVNPIVSLASNWLEIDWGIRKYMENQKLTPTCLAVMCNAVNGMTYPKTDIVCDNFKHPTCFSSSRGFHLANQLCFANCHQFEKLYLRSLPLIIGELWRWSRWLISDPFSGISLVGWNKNKIKQNHTNKQHTTGYTM